MEEWSSRLALREAHKLWTLAYGTSSNMVSPEKLKPWVRRNLVHVASQRRSEGHAENMRYLLFLSYFAVVADAKPIE